MNDPQRNVAWTVAAWLGIAFGVVGFLYSCVLVLFFVGSFFDRLPAPGTFHVSSLFPQILLPVLALGPSLLAFFAGLGLLRRRPFGRICTLVFGALSILFVALAISELWLQFLGHLWRTFHGTELPNGPSLPSRFLEVLAETPLYLAYAIGAALLSRSVYLHRDAFGRGRTRSSQ